MPLIDLILNVAGLLLWLNFRALRFDPLVRTSAASLAGTLKRAEPRRVNRWNFFGALSLLLFFRAWLYAQIGPAVSWMPCVRFGAISVTFRSDYLGRMLVFSFLSFLVILAGFYFGLLLLAIVNGKELEGDPWDRQVRLHLGWAESWPRAVKLACPLLLVGAAWFPLSYLLTAIHLSPTPLSLLHRTEQALVVGLGAYLPWKYFAGAILSLWLINSYVYLGNQPFWSFIASTGGNLLKPLRALPLRVGKIDFAPLVAIAIIFLGAEVAERGLTWLYQRLPL